MCCELQQGVQLLALSMAGQEGLQASIDLVSQQVRELGACRSRSDEAIESQLRAFQEVLEATAASSSNALAEVTSALTALSDVRSCSKLTDGDLQLLSRACHASLVPLEQHNRALFDQMAEAQRAQDAWAVDLVAECKVIMRRWAKDIVRLSTLHLSLLTQLCRSFCLVSQCCAELSQSWLSV